jgi:phosphatidate cytidylyltransferase
MLKQRIISAAVCLPIVILIIWFGDPWFSLLIAAAALAGTFEFYHMVKTPSLSTEKNEGTVIHRSLICFGLIWSLAIALSPSILHYKAINSLPIIMAFATIISLTWILCQSPRERAFYKWAWIVAGVLYIGWMLSYWLNLRILEEGRNWVYLAMLTTFANDTGAFFVGRKWGKHQLAHTISPGKTWEGALGGLISAIIAAIVITIILNFISVFSVKYWQAALLGCLISLFAQLGDLVESLLKRNADVKDAGKLLPGHGGILDRFDSLIFVGPMVYYCIIWVI